MTNKNTSINADGISEPFAAVTVPVETWSQGSRFGSSTRHLSRFAGGSHVGVLVEELLAGKESTLSHYHLLEEEHVYILDGTLTLRLGPKEYVISAGDYVCFPAGQKAGHSMFNHSAAVCRYILVGENNPNDVIVYPESGRVSVRLTGEGYRKLSTMGYWEDVDGA